MKKRCWVWRLFRNNFYSVFLLVNVVCAIWDDDCFCFRRSWREHRAKRMLNLKDYKKSIFSFHFLIVFKKKRKKKRLNVAIKWSKNRKKKFFNTSFIFFRKLKVSQEGSTKKLNFTISLFKYTAKSKTEKGNRWKVTVYYCLQNSSDCTKLETRRVWFYLAVKNSLLQRRQKKEK